MTKLQEMVKLCVPHRRLEVIFAAGTRTSKMLIHEDCNIIVIFSLPDMWISDTISEEESWFLACTADSIDASVDEDTEGVPKRKMTRQVVLLETGRGGMVDLM